MTGRRERLARSVESIQAKAGEAAATALQARRVELAALDASLEEERARERGAARAAFEAHVALVQRLATQVGSVEVRRMNVVVRKRP